MKKNTVSAIALGLAFLASSVTFAQEGAKPTEKKEEHKHETIKQEIKDAEKKHEEKKEEHKEKKAEEHKKHEEHK